MATVSPQFSVTVRVELDARQEPLGELTSKIAECGGQLQGVDLLPGAGPEGKRVREFTIDAQDREHWEQIMRAIGSTRGARVLEYTDRTLQMHRGGKISIENKYPLKTRDDLSMAYTPGVARVCQEIFADRQLAFEYTIKRNTVAVVSDGSAVLGLGDIGPEAAMPVMEGKAMLFKEFAGVDAFPICLSTKDVDEIVETVECDRYGAIHAGREDYEAGSMNTPKRWLAENTNPGRRDGSPREVIEGTDLFVGLSGPGIVDAADLQRMNPDPFVFAMANPNPEVRPEEAAPHVRVMATGRSDYPNQINNVLAFPGVFRGALDARATDITEEMKLAAAGGIASVVDDDELDEDYIIPSVFNRDVSQAVASAVREVAERSRESAAEPEQPTVERAAVS